MFGFKTKWGEATNFITVCSWWLAKSDMLDAHQTTKRKAKNCFRA